MCIRDSNVYAQGSDINNEYNYVDNTIVASSDYHEVTEVSLSPAQGLSMGHPLAVERSTAVAELSFTGSSFLEIVDVSVHSESHPGAFCGSDESPRLLKVPAPTTHPIRVSFDNTIAELQEGQMASAVLNVAWMNLDGTMEQLEIPIEVTARSAFDVVYRDNSNWSSKTVYSGDRVTITDLSLIHI